MSSSSTSPSLTSLSIPGLGKVASGKVREIFELDENTLLFVATERISAYDVVLSNGIPDKGALLTQLSAYWFDLIAEKLPDLKTHLLSTKVPEGLEGEGGLREMLEGRSMQVRRLDLIPLESIVRGYITGSAWAEYKAHGTFPSTIYSPSPPSTNPTHRHRPRDLDAGGLEGEPKT